MTVDYAKYVKPELVLADLAETAATLARILKAEASGKRDGDGTWHGANPLDDALHELAPRVAALARLYEDALSHARGPEDPPWKCS